MKLQVSNTNAATWRGVTVKSELPSQLKPLEELAKNLWWVWNSEAKSLFRDLNPDLWRSTGENPVMLLQQLSFERLQEIIADKELIINLNYEEIISLEIKIKDFENIEDIEIQNIVISDDKENIDKNKVEDEELKKIKNVISVEYKIEEGKISIYR